MNAIQRFISVYLFAAMALVIRADDTGSLKHVLLTANDNMKFNLTRIEASPGEQVEVSLKNEGTLPRDVMGHNWVLLKSGRDPMAYSAAAVSAKAENYQPKSAADQVLASIPLLGSKETGSVTFTAPSQPGHYAFLCSFPGHAQIGMRGELIVR